MYIAVSRFLFWLQSGSELSVDGRISVWQLITAAVAIVVGVALMKFRQDAVEKSMAAHEVLDEKRFKAITEAIAEAARQNAKDNDEMRQDIKDLIRHTQNAEPSVGAFVQSVMDRISKTAVDRKQGE